MKNVRNAIALGGIGTTALLVLLPLETWAAILLGLFLVVEIIALWATPREQT